MKSRALWVVLGAVIVSCCLALPQNRKQGKSGGQMKQTVQSKKQAVANNNNRPRGGSSPQNAQKSAAGKAPQAKINKNIKAASQNNLKNHQAPQQKPRMANEAASKQNKKVGSKAALVGGALAAGGAAGAAMSMPAIWAGDEAPNGGGGVDSMPYPGDIMTAQVDPYYPGSDGGSGQGSFNIGIRHEIGICMLPFQPFTGGEFLPPIMDLPKGFPFPPPLPFPQGSLFPQGPPNSPDASSPGSIFPPGFPFPKGMPFPPGFPFPDGIPPPPLPFGPFLPGQQMPNSPSFNSGLNVTADDAHMMDGMAMLMKMLNASNGGGSPEGMTGPSIMPMRQQQGPVPMPMLNNLLGLPENLMAPTMQAQKKVATG